MDDFPKNPRERPTAGRTLGMFAKYWEAGTVKTRLGDRLGMAAAAELHRDFVGHLLRQLSVVEADRYLFVTPDRRRDDFARCAPAGWSLETQGCGDLGERMQVFFQRCFRHASHVVLIGSDCPTLSASRIARAFDALSEHTAVLGPAADGGYYLIGLRGRWQGWMERLFTDMPWSSHQVAGVTRQRLRDAAVRWHELPEEEDIDTIDCLRRLDRRLAGEPQQAELAAAVRRALGGWGGRTQPEQGAPPGQPSPPGEPS